MTVLLNSADARWIAMRSPKRLIRRFDHALCLMRPVRQQLLQVRQGAHHRPLARLWLPIQHLRRQAFDQRDELIAESPDTYYLTDHYVDYPVVLVRLPRVDRDALRDLLGMAWRFESTRAKPRARQRKRG